MKTLDSDIIIAALRGKEDAVVKLEDIRKDGIRIAITVFNEQEILFGALLSGNKDYFQICQEFLNSFDKLSYNQNCVSNAIKVIYELEKKGRHVGVIDETIAGICITNNSTLITRNSDHFSRVPGLKIEKW